MRPHRAPRVRTLGAVRSGTSAAVRGRSWPDRPVPAPAVPGSHRPSTIPDGAGEPPQRGHADRTDVTATCLRRTLRSPARGECAARSTSRTKRDRSPPTHNAQRGRAARVRPGGARRPEGLPPMRDRQAEITQGEGGPKGEPDGAGEPPQRGHADRTDVTATCPRRTLRSPARGECAARSTSRTKRDRSPPTHNAQRGRAARVRPGGARRPEGLPPMRDRQAEITQGGGGPKGEPDGAGEPPQRGHADRTDVTATCPRRTLRSPARGECAARSTSRTKRDRSPPTHNAQRGRAARVRPGGARRPEGLPPMRDRQAEITQGEGGPKGEPDGAGEPPQRGHADRTDVTATCPRRTLRSPARGECAARSTSRTKRDRSPPTHNAQRGRAARVRLGRARRPGRICLRCETGKPR